MVEVIVPFMSHQLLWKLFSLSFKRHLKVLYPLFWALRLRVLLLFKLVLKSLGSSYCVRL
jgi:hypothetical protein